MPSLRSAVCATLVFSANWTWAQKLQTIHVHQAHVLPPSAASQYAHRPKQTNQNIYEGFQVYPPVLNVNKANDLVATNADPFSPKEIVASNVKKCVQTLAVHSFANSYGASYVGTYNPPPCSFNSVTWNLTVQTSGIQYDRMGSVSFDSTELFRTTTIEPDINVTQWTYLKDMSPFLSLFSSSHKLIFDLPNIIDTSLNPPINGDYNVTLTATYFTVDTSYVPADKIYTISQDLGSTGQPSYFTFPTQNASSSITLPRNIKKAIYTVVAVGQADEEFWWDNAPNPVANTFPSPYFFYPFSSFREVQVFIDGTLAGVAWPFPILFSGADDPQLWRPIGGIDILDLKEYEIDITPWLPVLCDGKAHTFTMAVSGINSTGLKGPSVLSETVGNDWFLGGKVFVWLDKAGHITTGNGPHITGLTPSLSITSSFTQNRTHANQTLNFNTNAQRNLAYHSTINLSTGSEDVYWQQNLHYTASSINKQQGIVSTINILTNGLETSSSGYSRNFAYPFFVRSTAIYLDFLRSKDVTIHGDSVFPTGLGTFFANQTGKGSSTELEQQSIYNNGSLSANTHLTFTGLVQSGTGYAVANETLFTQDASASQDVLTGDVIKFLVKPDVST